MPRQSTPFVIEHRFAPPSPEADELLARVYELVLARARRIEEEEAQRQERRQCQQQEPPTTQTEPIEIALTATRPTPGYPLGADNSPADAQEPRTAPIPGVRHDSGLERILGVCKARGGSPLIEAM